MDVILLQKVRNLGNLGDTVAVRPGYGRNYLMPRGIALAATKTNLQVFEERRSDLMAQSAERFDRATARAEKIQGKEFILAMRASDEGKLFGSVGPHEVAAKVTEETVEVDAKEIALPDGQIRQVGYHTVLLQLHPEVELEVTVVVAQQTDMGINMPSRPGTEEAEAAAKAEAEAETEAEEAAAEEAEGEAEQAEANSTETDEDA